MHLFPHRLSATYPAHLILFALNTLITCEEHKLLSPLIMQSPPPSCHFKPLSSKYSPVHTLFTYPQCVLSLNLWQQVSHPHKTACNSFVYFKLYIFIYQILNFTIEIIFLILSALNFPLRNYDLWTAGVTNCKTKFKECQQEKASPSWFTSSSHIIGYKKRVGTKRA
jgi:hypothetical protein